MAAPTAADEGPLRDGHVALIRRVGLVFLGLAVLLPLELVLGLAVLAGGALYISRGVRRWVVR